MAVKNYFSVGGQIIAERNSSTDDVAVYLRDNLGSVAETRHADPVQDNRYLYYPYGDLMFTSGSGPNPKYLWVGSWGYRETSLNYASHYVRARHYDKTTGSWTTLDPLWPEELPFCYTRGKVLAWVDFSGKRLVHGIGCNAGSGGDIDRFLSACEKLRKCVNDKKCFEELVKCVGVSAISDWYKKVLTEVTNLCLDEGTKICVICGQDKLPKECHDLCKSSETLALAPEPLDRKLCEKDVIDPFPDRSSKGAIRQGLPVPNWRICKMIMIADNMVWIKECTSTIILCKGRGRAAVTVIHELFHVAGIAPHNDHGNRSGKNDLVYRSEQCLSKVIR